MSGRLPISNVNRAWQAVSALVSNQVALYVVFLLAALVLIWSAFVVYGAVAGFGSVWASVALCVLLRPRARVHALPS